MNTKTFLSAVATGILALSMGGHAMAADVSSGTQAAVKTATTNQNMVVLEAGTDPSSLQLHFNGAQKVTFYDAGTLQITKADGSTWKYRPSITQNVNGKRKYLVPGFRIVGKDRVAVVIANWDSSSPVILDGHGPNS